ncbi:MAG: methyl-accepting chemotaxis protein [Lachnospiraceae bacterium]|nr:methyl-accepting chemotaxis protein [Lachnospiraceae bacterium]
MAKASEKKKGIGIQGRMLLMIIPVVVAFLVAVSLVGAFMANREISDQTSKYLDAEIRSNVESIDRDLEMIRITAENLSIFVGNTYKTADISSYAKIFSDTVLSNDLILGSGIWFEPYVYEGDAQYAGEQYVGPYWYRDGSSVVEDWEYSNAEYDYFVQEYYTNAKAMRSLEAVITDPYYDPASASVMASCSAPIFDAAGQYIGCITVDIGLETISELIGSIQVGKAGYAVLVSSNGTYIYSPDSSKTAQELKLSDDPDAIGRIGGTVTGAESGSTQFADGKETMSVSFRTVPEVNWRLLLILPDSEVREPVLKMINAMFMLCILAIVISSLIIFFVARSLARPIVGVSHFASVLASGDFTIDELSIRRSDELGMMGNALNDMYRSNKGIIRDISTESDNINDAASTLGAMSEELSAEFARIQDNMVGVNEAMMSTSAATEEVSASATEVNNSVMRLAKETEEIAREVEVITKRADQVQRDSKEAYDSAISIARQRETELREATKNAEVVSEIENLANAISDIASEIDLLSLNASIEAARAGDAGRGFAVVAQQINKLATETAEAVEQIQNTVSSVQDAVKGLSDGSGKLLEFVTETVTPDYEKFNNIGVQYGQDAEQFGSFSEQIREMAEYIRSTMDEVNTAVANIAESTQDTSTRSADVTESVGSVTDAVESVAELATNQQVTAGHLTDMVRQFKL